MEEVARPEEVTHFQLAHLGRVLDDLGVFDLLLLLRELLQIQDSRRRMQVSEEVEQVLKSTLVVEPRVLEVEADAGALLFILQPLLLLLGEREEVEVVGDLVADLEVEVGAEVLLLGEVLDEGAVVVDDLVIVQLEIEIAVEARLPEFEQ